MEIAILLIILGIGAAYKGYKIMDNRKKYEFENRTDGGTVKFEKWGDTKKHSALIRLGKLIGSIGVIMIFIGVMILTFNLTN